MTLTVALCGLGAIGMEVARGLDSGIDGLTLIAVAARDREAAHRRVATLNTPPAVVMLPELAAADIVVEAAPAAIFAEVAEPAIDAGRIFMPASVGALLSRMDLIDRARRSGARILPPTGALLGLDAVRAAAEGEVNSVTLESRKPPLGYAGAPWVVERNIDLKAVTEPTCIFDGSALSAVTGFPANANVAAALALAGIGAERTRVKLWADPTIQRNVHMVSVDSAVARFTMTIEGVPSPANPRSSRLTPLSILASLRGLVSTLKSGS
ncbi:MAG: aspartate dehydrogenase [Dongiaceae bacterium]